MNVELQPHARLIVLVREPLACRRSHGLGKLERRTLDTLQASGAKSVDERRAGEDLDGAARPERELVGNVRGMRVVRRAAGDPAVLVVQGLDVIPVELVVASFSRYGPELTQTTSPGCSFVTMGLFSPAPSRRLRPVLIRAHPSASSACGGSLGSADADEVGEGSTDDDGSADEVGSAVTQTGSTRSKTKGSGWPTRRPPPRQDRSEHQQERGDHDRQDRDCDDEGELEPILPPGGRRWAGLWLGLMGRCSGKSGRIHALFLMCPHYGATADELR